MTTKEIINKNKELKKKQIIKFMRKEKKPVATSKIAINVKSNSWHIKHYLIQLKEEGKITQMVTPNSIYWELKKGEPIKKMEVIKK